MLLTPAPASRTTRAGRPWVNRIDSREGAEAVVKSAWNRAAVVEEVEVRRVHHRPPSLYDLTDPATRGQ